MVSVSRVGSVERGGEDLAARCEYFVREAAGGLSDAGTVVLNVVGRSSAGVRDRVRDDNEVAIKGGSAEAEGVRL